MGQLAYHVAMGLPLWNYPVRKGTVSYLALEDDYARLQRRLSVMFGVECADNLFFATQAKTLNTLFRSFPRRLICDALNVDLGIKSCSDTPIYAILWFKGAGNYGIDLI